MSINVKDYTDSNGKVDYAALSAAFKADTGNLDFLASKASVNAIPNDLVPVIIEVMRDMVETAQRNGRTTIELTKATTHIFNTFGDTFPSGKRSEARKMIATMLSTLVNAKAKPGRDGGLPLKGYKRV